MTGEELDSDWSVQVGATYDVVSILCGPGRDLSVRIYTDHGPIWFSSKMFTTVSQEIKPNWRVDIGADGIVRLGPGAFLVPGYWERFFDDEAYELPPAASAGVAVNVRVTLDPHADGTVGIGGNTTIYPSMETYQYRDGQPPVQVQWNPANSGTSGVRAPA